MCVKEENTSKRIVDIGVDNESSLHERTHVRARTHPHSHVNTDTPYSEPNKRFSKSYYYN